jgi:choline kinase
MLAYRQPGDSPLGDEEMKVRVRGGMVVAMSKAMDPADADGENVGLVRFDAPDVPLLVACLDRIVEAGGLREWAPRAFEAFAARQPLYAIGTRGYPWIEIDFPEDYERAVRDVLPLVDAGGASVPSPAALPRLATGLTGG